MPQCGVLLKLPSDFGLLSCKKNSGLFHLQHQLLDSAYATINIGDGLLNTNQNAGEKELDYLQHLHTCHFEVGNEQKRNCPD